MTILQRIFQLRNFLKNENIDYLLINTCDEFLQEYNEMQYSPRFLVTNFSGSTGDALLSQKDLFLFVDGRYHIQADNEVDKNIVKVVKLKLTESFLEALIKKINKNSTVAILPESVSLNFFTNFEKFAKEKNIKIKLLDKNPYTEFILENSFEKKIIKEIPLEISGESCDEKIKKLQQELDINECFLITKLEDIAYYTNCRNYDIPYSSSFKSRLIILKDKQIIFCDENSFKSKSYEVQPLKNYLAYLKKIAPFKTIIYEKNSINLRDYLTIKENSLSKNAYIDKNIFNKKSIKNTKELAHIKECFIKTDKVLLEVENFIKNNDNFTEYDLALFVENEFKKQGANSLSFKTILAAGQNSAIIHYSTPSSQQVVNNGDLILLDCGAYFEGGYATDITRTFVKGKPKQWQKKLYTSVLKAFIAAFKTKIIIGYSPDIIDKKARNMIRKMSAKYLKGFDFPHSTGHGVGICVHEAPPFVSQSKLAKLPLEPNMVFTIEPGLYKKNKGGVRLENTVFLDNNYKIKTLSKAPWQEELIEYSLLSSTEKAFVKKWNEGLF